MSNRSGRAGFIVSKPVILISRASRKIKARSLASSFAFVLLLVAGPAAVNAAENLRLREGISFVHDVDKGFPIIADKLDDIKIEPGKVAFLFFGAAGDLNTNRQARRVVELYKKMKDAQLKFIIVDVDHVTTPEAKQLIKSYYQGYIPQEVLLDKQGKTFWTHIGEIDSTALTAQLTKIIN